jgi:hypothetical protein
MLWLCFVRGERLGISGITLTAGFDFAQPARYCALRRVTGLCTWVSLTADPSDNLGCVGSRFAAL